MKFNEKLKIARKEAKITQVELAKKLNVTQGTVANWERGVREPDIETIQRIATALNINIDTLFSDLSSSNNKHPKPKPTDRAPQADAPDPDNWQALRTVLEQLPDGDVVVPDVSVTCDPSKLNEHGCIGAPDWVIEILSSNRNDDLVYKLDLYQKSGVREYWIIDPKHQMVFVYFFESSPNVVELHDWNDEISVRIYGGNLTIRIADLV